MHLPGIPQTVGDHLILKSCSSPADIERVIAINNDVHGEIEAKVVRGWLVDGHPQFAPESWLYIHDTKADLAAATLSLMPLAWRFENVSLPVAELGFVSTRPAYRHQGLQRMLSAAFDRIALANNYSLAGIEGIPYFYRQFGYEYAVPLFDSRVTLTLAQIPAGELEPYAFRPATAADIPLLSAAYRQHSAPLSITTERSAAMWAYYLELDSGRRRVQRGEVSGLRLFIMEKDGQTANYLALFPSGWTNQLNVAELSADTEAAILAALRFAGSQAELGQHETVGLQLPAGHPAVEFLRYRGFHEEGTYGWQMKVLDPVRFLDAIAPALEARLARTVLRGTSGSLNFNLYRHNVGLHIMDGRVTAKALAADVEADVNMPPTVATQLWLGWKPFADLDDWTKDVSARDEKRHLLDILFPPLQAHIYLGY